jgi:hypothetical protein
MPWAGHAAPLTLRLAATANAEAAPPRRPLVLGLLGGGGHRVAPLVGRLGLRNALHSARKRAQPQESGNHGTWA